MSPDRPPEAQWISLRALDRKTLNQWICFRKSVDMAGPPEPVRVRIACDSKYWLWINGELVVHEGQLKRGPTPQDTYCDELDIALNAGANQIALLVWYFGKEGFCHKSSGVPALLFDSGVLTSDRTWKVCEHPAFGESGPPYPNRRLPESNLHFDARLDLCGWTMPGYDDSRWENATELGLPPTHPWGRLIPRPVPQWRLGGLEAYCNEADFPDGAGWLESRVVRALLPGNLPVCPYLKVDAMPGRTISICTDNYRGGGEFNVRADYVTKDGVQEFESPAYLTGHEVIYDLPSGVRLLDLKYRPTQFDTDIVGSFECSDSFVNTLWQKSANTMLINMRDGIQDPDRERSQWWGDVVILIGMILHSCDGRGRTAIRKAISNLVDWQKPDGTLYSPVPAGNWFQELPDQMLAAIGKYGFWYYYRHTGDREMIAHCYPAVKRYLALWRMGADGLVVRRVGGWDWGDWGDNKDMPLLINAWFHMALEAARDMAHLLGETHDREHWQSLMDGMKQSFNRVFWTGTEYRSPGHDGPPDDRGQALAVLAGFAEESMVPVLAGLFDVQFHASPYMEKYVLEALFLMGYPQRAMDRMKQRYAMMVQSPYSTLWESWSLGDAAAAKFGGGSYNHGWSGGPLTLMAEFVAGIRPLTPNFESFTMAPCVGLLEHFACAVPTGHGEVLSIRQEASGKNYSITVRVPPGSSGTLVLPGQSPIPLAAGTHSFQCERIQIQ